VFVFVSTANVPDGVIGGPQTIRASGIRTLELAVPDPGQYEELRLVLEWAFLTSRANPAAFNDSAIVRVKSGTDSATVFRVTTADLLAGRQPQRSGGCGEEELFPGRAVTYATCTDWRTTTVDLTAWLDRTFVIQFIVGEAGTVVEGADQPAALLFRRAVVEGGK
jgi:hypothetical protein